MQDTLLHIVTNPVADFTQQEFASVTGADLLEKLVL
jgi:hypothetical protein